MDQYNYRLLMRWALRSKHRTSIDVPPRSVIDEQAYAAYTAPFRTRHLTDTETLELRSNREPGHGNQIDTSPSTTEPSQSFADKSLCFLVTKNQRH